MRSWLVIPAMGAAAAAAALALRETGAQISLIEVLAAAAAGAALAAAVRALAGESAAALAAAAIAPLLAVVALAERKGGLAGGPADGLAAPCLALAGLGWAVAELARPGSSSRRLVLVPAALAGSGLAELWLGGPVRPISPLLLMARAAEALGPIAAIAALAGLAALARPRRGPPQLAAAACIAGALLADLRAGAIGPLTLGLGALAAALGAARFAGQIRPPAGQALAGAAVGLMLLLPPAWTALDLASR